MVSFCTNAIRNETMPQLTMILASHTLAPYFSIITLLGSSKMA